MTNNLFDDVDLNNQSSEVVEEVFETAPEEIQEEEIFEAAPEESTDSYINEALDRIEQAQLYRTILKHSLFAQGSTNQAIQARVEKEIRDFCQFRLEVLVGIRQERSSAPAASEFTPEEVDALRALASKVIEKSGGTPPQHEPALNQVAATRQPGLNRVPAKQAPAKPSPAKKVAVKKPATKRPSENVSEITGADLSQAVPTFSRPLPMPGIKQMNQMAAQSVQAAESSMAMDASGKGGILSALAKASVKMNSHLPEEE